MQQTILQSDEQIHYCCQRTNGRLFLFCVQSFSRVWHTEQKSRAHTDPNTTRTGSPSIPHNQKFFPRIKTAYNKIQAQILLHVAGVL